MMARLARAAANPSRSQAISAALRAAYSASPSGVRPRLLLLPTTCSVTNVMSP